MKAGNMNPWNEEHMKMIIVNAYKTFIAKQENEMDIRTKMEYGNT